MCVEVAGHEKYVSLRPGSAEREVKSLQTRIKKLDLELSTHDRAGLPDELVKSLFDNGAVALGVDIKSMSAIRRLSIDAYAKSHGSSLRCGPHDKIEITRMKAVRDSPRSLIQRNCLFPYRPVT